MFPLWFFRFLFFSSPPLSADFRVPSAINFQSAKVLLYYVIISFDYNFAFCIKIKNHGINKIYFRNKGTIGGKPGEGLTPVDIIKFTAAYGSWLQKRFQSSALNVVVRRDARRSGSMVSSLIINTLSGLGINVTDLGLATTPTVEVAVTGYSSHGGLLLPRAIILKNGMRLSF